MGEDNGLVQEKDPAFVRFKGIEKQYGKVVAVKKMDLEIASHFDIPNHRKSPNCIQSGSQEAPKMDPEIHKN